MADGRADDKIRVEVEADEAKKTYEELGRAGDQSFKQQSKGAASATASIGKWVVGLGIAHKAYSALASTMRQGIAAALENERTTIRLTQALRGQGFEISANLTKLNRQSAELERLTGISDETVRGMQGLATSLGVLPESIDKVVRASISMSNAVGIDAESAMRQLLKSLSGMKGELGELLPFVKDMTAEQLKSGQVVDKVNEEFGEQLTLMTEGTGGAQVGLTNAWSNFAEAMGQATIKSEAYKRSLSGLTDFLKRAEADIGEKGIIRAFMENLITVETAEEIEKRVADTLAARRQADLGEIDTTPVVAAGVKTKAKAKTGRRGPAKAPSTGAGIAGDPMFAAIRDAAQAEQEARSAELANAIAHDENMIDREEAFQDKLAARKQEALDFQIELTNKMAEDAERGQQALMDSAWGAARSLISSFSQIERNRIDSWERQAKSQATTQEEMEAVTAAAERKRFEAGKVSAISQAVLAGASGVAQSLGSAPMPYAAIIAAIHATVAAAQVAAIASQQFGGGADVSVPSVGAGGGVAGAGGGFAAPDDPLQIPEQNLRPINVTVVGDLGSEDVTRIRKALQREMDMGIGA